MIQLQVIGRVGKDATVNNVGGKSVINFSVADSHKGKDGKEYTTWVNCAYWTDKTNVANYIKKGGMVYVSGTPSARAHEGKAYLELSVSKVELLGGNKSEGQAVADPLAVAAVSADGLPF